MDSFHLLQSEKCESVCRTKAVAAGLSVKIANNSSALNALKHLILIVFKVD